MVNKINGELTFKDLEAVQGINESLSDSHEKDYPLPLWYLSVREKPLKDFSIEDLCISCRQNLFIEVTVPLSVKN